MTLLNTTPAFEAAPAPRAARLVLLVMALFLLREIVLWASPVPLAPDEAQYAGWSRAPDWGYYSKPPWIAWAMGLACQVCGGAGEVLAHEGCVRWLQPVATAGAALGTAGVTAALFGSTGLAVAAAALVMALPAVTFYALFATTDAWLLCWWALAWWALVRAQGPLVVPEDASAGPAAAGTLMYWVLCGGAVGLGLLTKYSMAFFVLAALGWLIHRRQWLQRGPWIAVAVASVVFLPNLVWNAFVGFPTLAHHAEIAQASSGLQEVWTTRLAHGGRFLAEQFGVFGPWVVVAAGLAVLRDRRLTTLSAAATGAVVDPQRRWREGQRMAMVFAGVPLLIVVGQSLLSRAFANWAMPAAIGLVVLAISHWGHPGRTVTGARRWRGLTFSLGLGIVLAGVLAIGPTLAARSPGFAESRLNPYRRLEGWRELGALVRSLVAHRQDPAGTGAALEVVSTDREMLAALSAYAWPQVRRVRAWNPDRLRDNHYRYFQDLAALVPPGGSAPPLLLLVRITRPPEGQDSPEARLAAARAVLGPAAHALQGLALVPSGLTPGLADLRPGGRAGQAVVLLEATGFSGYPDPALMPAPKPPPPAPGQAKDEGS